MIATAKKTEILVIVLIRLVVDSLITIDRDLSLNSFSEPFTQILFLEELVSSND